MQKPDRPVGLANALPFSGLGAAEPATRFYADASAATRSVCNGGMGGGVLRYRPLTATRIFRGLIDSTIDNHRNRALAIEKVLGVHLTANRTSRTLPIESRRSVYRRACADTRPNGHDPPKARSTGPAHRLPSARMLVEITSQIDRWPYRTYALPGICKRPFRIR
jgi:hypothetical protein